MIPSLIKTLIINLFCLPIRQAIRLPIILSGNVNIRGMSGKIHLDEAKFGMIRIGFHDVGIFDKKRSRCILDIQGTWKVKGPCSIGHGSKIAIDKEGELVTGVGFEISAESQIIVRKRIEFGDGVLISWDTLFMDTDYHSIMDETGNKINDDRDIQIGNRVWIGCRSTILKGSRIGNDSVIAAGSCISGDFELENVIIGGIPGRVIRNGIQWKQ